MGAYSALAANGDLCSQKLGMPTELTGQNGVRLSQLTPVEVEGCPGALRIASRSVSGREVTVKVYAPAAGTVKVFGNGLTSQGTTAEGHEMLRFTLRQKRAEKLRRACGRASRRRAVRPARGRAGAWRCASASRRDGRRLRPCRRDRAPARSASGPRARAAARQGQAGNGAGGLPKQLELALCAETHW